MKHIRAFDGLRGIAIGLVVLFHLGYFPSGWTGVQLFFVLSGFLITRILIDSKARSRSNYFRRFYWRRTLRIFPLYFSFLLVVSVLYWTLGKPDGYDVDWPYLWSYTHNLARVAEEDVRVGSLVHLWSLSVEEQFYLVWPAIVFLLSPRGLNRLLVVLLIAVPLSRMMIGMSLEGHADHYVGRVIYSLPTSHFDAFATGALVSIYDLVKPERRRLALIIGILGLGGLGFLSLLVLYLQDGCNWETLGYAHFLSANYQYVWGYTVINIVSALAILAVRDGNQLGRWLETRFLVYLGQISYGIYLMHVPVLHMFYHYFPWYERNSRSLPGLAMSLMYLAVVLMMAGLSFKYFEAKILKYKGK